jgi:hypothetical protein
MLSKLLGSLALTLVVAVVPVGALVATDVVVPEVPD